MNNQSDLVSGFKSPNLEEKLFKDAQLEFELSRGLISAEQREKADIKFRLAEYRYYNISC